jgi:hypothetical protein
MDKTMPNQALSGRPIAKKIVAKMKLHWQRKVVNIKNVIAGHAMAEELQKTVVSQKELEGFHPAHAAYVYAQNQVSVMSEQLTALKEMSPFVDIISRAEDLYVPSAPPMSPLTTSYFTCWAFFRRLRWACQRDRRHHYFGGRRRLRHARRAVARDAAHAGFADGLLHPSRQGRRRKHS